MRRRCAVAEAGLSITLVERDADDPKGTVIAQRPDPGRFVREHGDVELVVSRGPPAVTVPDISNAASVGDVIALLAAAGFAVASCTVRRHRARRTVVATDPSFPTKSHATPS